MTQSISAAIHIHGSTVRYAALAREEDALRLQRLGQRTFDVDVTRVLWEGSSGPDGLDRIKTGVQEAFVGVEVTSLRLVLHPLDVYSFFTPVPAGLSTEARERHATPQAALVTGARSPDSLHLTLRPVRTVEIADEAIEWVHVLAVPQEVHKRMEGLLGALSVSHTARMISSEAAARLLGHAETEEAASADASFRLAIGAYADHTEYTLTCNRAWYHAHASQEARLAANRAYYAIGGLNRAQVPPNAIDGVFVYGPEASAQDVYEAVFECRPVSLDPFEHLSRMPERPQKTTPPGMHVPCIGGALDAPT